MNNCTTSTLADYRPRSVIGYGKFSTVINAKYKNTLVAIKIITKLHKNNKINNILPISASPTNYDTEINIIKRISVYNHPNVLSYYIIFNTHLTIYIVQEFSPNGELNPSNFKYLSATSELEDAMLAKLIDMLSAIQFLHSLNIIHRDIKPSNFLVFSNGVVKLTDFDTCYTLTNNIHQDKLQLYSKLIGTPLFLPPELLTHSTSKISDAVEQPIIEESQPQQQPLPPTQTTKKSKFSISRKTEPFLKLFNKSATTQPTPSSATATQPPVATPNHYNPFMLDLWSLGVTLHYLFYSCYPFYADNEFTLLHRIATANPETPDLTDLSFKVDPQFKLIKIIDNLLIKLPYQRWSIQNVLTELNDTSRKYKLLSYEPKNMNKPILIKQSTLRDLSISDLTDPPADDTQFTETSVLPTSTSDNTATQQFKFQLPIFMSPKDVRSSHWGDSILSQKNLNILTHAPKMAIGGDELNNSSSSLPLETSMLSSSYQTHNYLHHPRDQHQQQHDYQYHSLNPKPVTNTNTSDDWNTGNDYAKIMKKLDGMGGPPDAFTFTKPNLTGGSANNTVSNLVDKRSSVHTLPANFNLKSVRGSYKGLKHSEMMNFRDFMNNKDETNNSATPSPTSTTTSPLPEVKTITNKPSYNALDKQLANDYRLYTMDDYLDKL